MLQKRFIFFLISNKPCSGLGGCGFSGVAGRGHCGPPTAPKRTAEAFKQALRVFSGNGEPIV